MRWELSKHHNDTCKLVLFFTTELSNMYIYIDKIMKMNISIRNESIVYRYRIHVKQKVYDIFSTVMRYNFKEVVYSVQDGFRRVSQYLRPP